MKPVIRRGDLFWVNFDPAKATEIQKTRPALVLSHDLLNENSSRIIVAPITSNLKKVYSFEFVVKGHSAIEGKAMLDQMRAIDKSRLGQKIGSLSPSEMDQISIILRFTLGL
jgi:mRNA interferase MazF